MKFQKSKVEQQEDKRYIRRERLVLWFYRWSQVIMAISFCIAVSLTITGILRAELLDSKLKEVSLFLALALAIVITVLCFLINGVICAINDRRQHRMEIKSKVKNRPHPYFLRKEKE